MIEDDRDICEECIKEQIQKLNQHKEVKTNGTKNSERRRTCL